MYRLRLQVEVNLFGPDAQAIAEPAKELSDTIVDLLLSQKNYLAQEADVLLGEDSNALPVRMEVGKITVQHGMDPLPDFTR